MSDELQVRCCCDAHLLGYLPAPKGEAHKNLSFAYHVPVRILSPMTEPLDDGISIETITLEIATFGHQVPWHSPRGGEVVRARAYKAPHLPIETLRLLAGFRAPTLAESMSDGFPEDLPEDIRKSYERIAHES